MRLGADFCNSGRYFDLKGMWIGRGERVASLWGRMYFRLQDLV